jgi:PhnB protein
MAVKPIPDGYHTVTPYLTVKGADRLLDFVKSAFSAEETVRMDRPDGTIAHSEVQIGDSKLMLGEPTEQWDASSATMHLYVEDCEATYRRALDAGATSLQEPADQFYGDRMAGVRDPHGNNWWIATHIEDVPEDEMARRAEEWDRQQQS